jgi:hypothetical protein
MIIDAATGLVTWTPTAAQAGSHQVAVVAADGRGGQATQTFDLAVVVGAPNRPPTIASTPRTTAGLGTSYLYAVEASDPDGDPLTFTLETRPDGMTVNPAGLIAWTPAAAQLGPNAVRLRVVDGRGGFATQDFTITVAAQTSNRPPRIVSTPPLAATVGEPYGYDLAAEDPEGDLLGWSLDAFPAGMSIDPVRGTLRWSPSADQGRTQTVVVRVGDTREAPRPELHRHRPGRERRPDDHLAPPTRAAVGQWYTYAVGRPARTATLPSATAGGGAPGRRHGRVRCAGAAGGRAPSRSRRRQPRRRGDPGFTSSPPWRPRTGPPSSPRCRRSWRRRASRTATRSRPSILRARR